MSNEQELARQWLRGVWEDLLHKVLEFALREAQAEAAADQIASGLWHKLLPEEMARLDQADPTLLRRGKEAVPIGFHAALERALTKAALPLAAINIAGNKHGAGGRLKTIISQEIKRGTHIDRAIDWAFSEHDSDDFTRPWELRDLVLRRLFTLAGKDLAALATTDDDAELKRRLKILAALATPGGSATARTKRVCSIRTGKTADFPYVLKYVGDDTIPGIQIFKKSHQPTIDGFSESLIAKFPGADLVRECLRRYIDRVGVLAILIDPDAPITDSFSKDFAKLSKLVPRRNGGILMPKDVALSESRRDRFRMPDGIACALGIATLIESLLRQVVSAKNWGSPKKSRGGELVKRVSSNIRLARETEENLLVIFDQRSLSLRDAMAHAAFFADDEAHVEAVVGGLCQSLSDLLRDLDAAKILAEVLNASRWDAGAEIEPAKLATIDEQYQPGLNILDQLRDDEAREHVFKVLATAVPDKCLLGRAGILLWISGQRDEHKGAEIDEAQQFAALLGSLLVLEELLRALYEMNGQRVLRVTPGINAVRCHLAMLDDQSGELLDRTRLEGLFQHYGIEEKCMESFLAVKEIRDLAFHGCWEALQSHWTQCTHLVVKLVFTLCSIAHFKNA